MARLSNGDAIQAYVEGKWYDGIILSVNPGGVGDDSILFYSPQANDDRTGHDGNGYSDIVAGTRFGHWYLSPGSENRLWKLLGSRSRNGGRNPV